MKIARAKRAKQPICDVLVAVFVVVAKAPSCNDDDDDGKEQITNLHVLQETSMISARSTCPYMRFLFSFFPMRFSFCKRHETRKRHETQEPETSSTRFANSVLAIACTTSVEGSACHAERRKLQLAPLSRPPKHLLRSLRSQSRRQRKRHLKINIWEKVTIL